MSTSELVAVSRAARGGVCACACIAASLAFLACSADSNTTEASSVALSPDGPLYVLGVRFVTADTAVGYIVTVPSLEEGTWNLDRAVEVGQDAWIFRNGSDPLVWLASSRDPSVSRWSVQDDGSLVQDAFMTFAPLGLARSREVQGKTAAFLQDKAYFMSSDGQIVVWSPRDMAILGTIPYEVPAGFTPEGMFAGNEERVLVSINMYEDDSTDTTIYDHEVHLVEIDPRSDSIASETVDPSCTNLSSVSVSPSGTTYLSPRVPITTYRATLGEGHGPVTCARRITQAGAGYDPEFALELSDLVGGRPAGGLSVLDDELAFIRVWHQELAPPLASDRSNFEDLMFADAYQWWRWPIGAAAAEPVTGQLATTGQWDPIEMDGRMLLPVVEPDFSSTQLVELTRDGEMRPLISGPGTLLGVVRVR